jgi:hypothetical protein
MLIPKLEYPFVSDELEEKHSAQFVMAKYLFLAG